MIVKSRDLSAVFSVTWWLMAGCGTGAGEAGGETMPMPTVPTSGGVTNTPPGASGSQSAGAAGQPPAVTTSPNTTVGASAMDGPPTFANVHEGACVDVGTPDAAGNYVLKAHAANNYHFESEVTLNSIPIAPNAEFSIDWSGLTNDFQGHAMDPLADVDVMGAFVLPFSTQELADRLNADALGAADVVVPAVRYTEQAITRSSIFEFAFPGGVPVTPEEVLPYLDPAAEGGPFVFAAMAMQGFNLGENVKMVQAFHVDPNSTNTLVEVTPFSTGLKFKADLHSSPAVHVPVGLNTITVDWKEMTINAMGREFKDRSIDEVMIAQYSLTAEQLEEQFLDIELIYDRLWRAEVPAGRKLSLTELKDESQGTFPGIDGNGTWLLALICGLCGNPAPWYITRLEPCL